MSVSNLVVVGIYPTRAIAEQSVAALRTAGVRAADISLLYPENLDSKEVAQEKSNHTQAGAAIGGGSGVVVGGALGWLAGIVVLAIPGVGPFMAAGPILAALTGAGVGGVIGEIAGALVGMGFSEAEAKRYEGRVKHGEILLSVHAETSGSVERTKEVLRQTGAQDIIVTLEGRLTEMGDIRANPNAA